MPEERKGFWKGLLNVVWSNVNLKNAIIASLGSIAMYVAQYWHLVP